MLGRLAKLRRFSGFVDQRKSRDITNKKTARGRSLCIPIGKDIRLR